jgi:hypothetical protein
MAKVQTGRAKPAKQLRLAHVRANDYREIKVDGSLHRLEGAEVVITYHINDTLITAEEMRLNEQTEAYTSYLTTGVTEQKQRLDVVAIRIPIDAFLATADTIRQVISGLGVNQTEGNQK